jgi:hypothetical protein
VAASNSDGRCKQLSETAFDICRDQPATPEEIFRDETLVGRAGIELLGCLRNAQMG